MLRLDAGAVNGVGVLSSLHWDEVNPTCGGGLRQTVAISPSAPGRYCTLATGSGNWIYDHDGLPSNSENQLLALTICYNEAPGTVASLIGPGGVDPGKTIVTLAWTGAVTVSAPIYSLDYGGVVFESGLRQAATVDGSAFWVAGEATSGYGFVYVPSLSNPAPLVQVAGATTAQPGWNDARAVVTYMGNLYGVDSSQDAGWGGVFTIGTGLPTTMGSPAATMLPGFSGTASLWTIVFQNATQLWAATDGYGPGLGSVVGYSLNAGAWAQTSVQVINPTVAVYSISGRLEGGSFVLYAATAGAVYRWDATSPGASPCSIYTPPTKSTVRGVALAPIAPTPSSTQTSSQTPSATATPSAGWYCATCATNPSFSICCDCCDFEGRLEAGLCNDDRYAGCLPAPTWSFTRSSTPTPSLTASATAVSTSTSTPSTTAASTASASRTPVPTPDGLPALGGNAHFGFVPSCATNFTVPGGVHSIIMRAWGGGGGGIGGALGGAGAYVEGVAFVTPGETLAITVGDGGHANGAAPTCGGGGAGVAYANASAAAVLAASGGGATSIQRWDVVWGRWDTILVVGGGGGASTAPLAGGQPGAGIPNVGCGTYAPAGGASPAGLNGTAYAPNHGGGGGGGWLGGAAGVGAGGGGGTSCAPLLAPETTLSAAAAPGASFGVFEFTSPYWVAPGGRPGAAGLVSLSWSLSSTYGGSNWSSTSTASPSDTPSPSMSISMTPSTPPAPSPTAQCAAGTYRTFPSHDLVGKPAGAALLAANEAECQRACCNVPNCTGYAFSSGLQAMPGAAGLSAPCYLLTNVTQLVPNHVMTSGVLASVLAS